jgi:predicted nucleotidyltransferase
MFMLDLLTKSTVKKKLLLLFFYNQKREFYLREIASLIKTSVGTTKRELDRLLKHDLVTIKKLGNLSFYRLNSQNPLIPHLEGIIKNTIGIELALTDIFKKRADIDFAFIFGSYAKNNFKSDSDIDLFVIGKIKEEQLHKLVFEQESVIHRTINYHLSTPEEFKNGLKKSFFHNEITANYVLLTDNEDEFREIIGESDKGGQIKKTKYKP